MCKFKMDSHLKGIILNCTVKAFKITPLKNANVLQMTMDFYWGYVVSFPGSDSLACPASLSVIDSGQVSAPAIQLALTGLNSAQKEVSHLEKARACQLLSVQ